MTSNQIAYNKYLEDARHNVATEEIERHKADSARISSSASMSQAQTAALSQRETARHNLIEESIKQGQLRVESGKLSETTRHNKVSESISQQQSDRQYELGKYSNMSGRMQASASLQSARAAQLSAQAAQMGAMAQQSQAVIASARQQEDARHNKVAESISGVQSRASLRQAQAREVQAQAASRGMDIQEEMLPYNKAQAVASVMQKGANSVNQLTEVAKNIVGLIGGGKKR